MIDLNEYIIEIQKIIKKLDNDVQDLENAKEIDTYLIALGVVHRIMIDKGYTPIG